MKTTAVKESDIQRKWFVVDANGKVLGRMATQVAAVLRGKHKPVFTPNQDLGDHVVVINAAKVVLTAGKAVKKKYYHHSGYMRGGLKETNAEKMLREKPERLVTYAIAGMLPKTKLGKAMAKKLKVYAGPDHPHQAQQPQAFAVKEKERGS
ncbi:MAG: 50S ribosomal protein L13 [Candidatus Manganitrophus sp. SB1]|nr:50S ribosomal protein L13 [Candidatus Manganitrophus morganii]